MDLTAVAGATRGRSFILVEKTNNRVVNVLSDAAAMQLLKTSRANKLAGADTAASLVCASGRDFSLATLGDIEHFGEQYCVAELREIGGDMTPCTGGDSVGVGVGAAQLPMPPTRQK